MHTEDVDVLICGSGSAGLCAALWLARFGVNYKILERREGPLQVGQADGVQCRTVEVFESFSISEPLLKESYHVMELAFWSSDGADGIRRRRLAPDTEEGLSHQPHVILNQARVNGIMIDEILRIRRDRGDGIEYGCQVQDLRFVESSGGDEAATRVEVKASRAGAECVYRAKYVLGCDGAHSTVRKSLGFKMVGDSSDAVWGVMDIYPRTNFPDIRKKSVLQSDVGNIVLIPREGDAIVRFYIELPGKEASEVTLEYLHERARLIFQPYKMEIAETAWWSAYAIGQRLADHFTKDNRVFLTGDACHTHSPKAGQGMNVSLQDGYNIGWKLGHVLTGRAPVQILETYVSERQQTATELIEFDRYFTKLFSTSYRREHGITADDFGEQFIKAGRYTAGMATQYRESSLVRPMPDRSAIASNVTVGTRFPTAMVVRFCDARPTQLITALPAEGQWHLVVFGGDVLTAEGSKRLERAAQAFEELIRAHTPVDAASDSVVRSILVLSSERTRVEPEHIPGFFMPLTGPLRMRSLHRVFVDGEGYNTTGCGKAFASYGINPSHGAVIIVRPDQYVSQITSLEDTDTVREFFNRCLLRP